ncbi:hypothetical protein D3C85_281070 [compost metagenome]
MNFNDNIVKRTIPAKTPTPANLNEFNSKLLDKMKNIMILLFLILSYSCNKANIDDNIRIKNADLKNKILQFDLDAKHYMGRNTDNTVSVAFWKDSNEIRVGFYSSQKLKDRDYLGKTNADKITVYFYSTDASAFKDLIDVTFRAKAITSKKDVSHTYTCFYIYKNGKLELITPK